MSPVAHASALPFCCLKSEPRCKCNTGCRVGGSVRDRFLARAVAREFTSENIAALGWQVDGALAKDLPRELVQYISSLSTGSQAAKLPLGPRPMTEIEATLSAIARENPTGYGKRPLPCDMDEVVARFVDAFVAAGSLERRRVGSQGNETLSRVLLCFAERMASLSVRLGSEAHLGRGLAAVVAEGWGTDPRENLMVVSLLYDAAARLGLDPAEAFGKVLPFATQSVKDSFGRFFTRSAEDQSIEAMGYTTNTDSQGFRYERTW